MKSLLRYLIMWVIPLIAFVLLTSQCEGDVLIEAEPQIVVEGYIDDGGYPVVGVTLTFPVSTEEHTIADMKEHILRWAKVSISDGNQTEVMVGRYHEGYFPPYVYTTTSMRGQAGHSYTITVDYRQYHATAVTTIPAVAAMDSVVMRPLDFEHSLQRDSLVIGVSYPMYYQADIYLRDNPLTKDYYAVFVRTGEDQRQFLLSHLGMIDDASLQGASQIPVYRGHSIQTGNYQRYFTYGEPVGIKFARVDAQSFQILKDYEDNMLFGSNMFMASSRNISSNVVGGLGYWIGCGASYAYFLAGLSRYPIVIQGSQP